MVNYLGSIIHFGDKKSQHYKDLLGRYSHLDHLDEKRRRNYLKRSAGITDKSGNLTKDDPTKANYYSRRFLWAA